MTTLNLEQMSTKQLVEWYNQNVGPDKMVKKFTDRKTAERRCAELAAHLSPESEEALPPEAAEVSEPVEQQTEVSVEEKPALRPVMRESLKLDRTIRCVTTRETFKNAYQMWREYPSWMTSSQQDRLTSQLYSAAKRGEKIRLEINNRVFELVNVKGK